MMVTTLRIEMDVVVFMLRITVPMMMMTSTKMVQAHIRLVVELLLLSIVVV